MTVPWLATRLLGFTVLAVAIGTTCAAISEVGAEELSQAETTDSSCIDVVVEGSWIGRLDCLNADLRKLAQTRHDQVSALYGAIGAGAAAPPSQIGLFNQAATEERLGSNFGKSAFPQRPPPPTYTLPFGGGHH